MTSREQDEHKSLPGHTSDVAPYRSNANCGIASSVSHVIQDSYVDLSLTLLRALQQCRVVDAIAAARAIEALAGADKLPSHTPAALLLAMQSELSIEPSADNDSSSLTDVDDDNSSSSDDDDDDVDETLSSSSEESNGDVDSDLKEEEEYGSVGSANMHEDSRNDGDEALTGMRAAPATSRVLTIRQRVSSITSHTPATVARTAVLRGRKTSSALAKTHSKSAEHRAKKKPKGSSTGTPISSSADKNSIKQATTARVEHSSQPNQTTPDVQHDDTANKGKKENDIMWTQEEEDIWNDISTSVEREMQRLAVARKNR